MAESTANGQVVQSHYLFSNTQESEWRILILLMYPHVIYALIYFTECTKYRAVRYVVHITRVPP